MPLKFGVIVFTKLSPKIQSQINLSPTLIFLCQNLILKKKQICRGLLNGIKSGPINGAWTQPLMCVSNTWVTVGQPTPCHQASRAPWPSARPRPSPLPPHVPQFAPPLCHCWPDRTLPSHQCHNAPSSALPHPLPPPARYAMANPPSFPSSPIHCPEAAARLPQSAASLLSFIPTILATTVPSRGGVCYRIFFLNFWKKLSPIYYLISGINIDHWSMPQIFCDNPSLFCHQNLGTICGQIFVPLIFR